MFTGLVEGWGGSSGSSTENGGRRLTIAWPGLPGRRAARTRRERGRQRLLPDGRGGRRRDLRGPGRARDARPNQPGKPEEPATASTSSGRSRSAPARRPFCPGAHRHHRHPPRPPARGRVGIPRLRHRPGLDPAARPKGSIAVDGVSLTLVDVWPDAFSVMLIPHTLAVTTLGIIRPGDRVNIEADILAKHVQKAAGAVGSDDTGENQNPPFHDADPTNPVVSPEACSPDTGFRPGTGWVKTS